MSNDLFTERLLDYTKEISFHLSLSAIILNYYEVIFETTGCLSRFGGNWLW
jgi:hypothetical protein